MLTGLRHSLRTLHSDRGFAAAAIVTLALGIGANTAVFSLLRAVLFAPLPFDEPDRIVALYERRGGSRDANLPVSGHEYVAWKERTRTLEAVALFREDQVHLTGAGEPERLLAIRASAGYLPLLGIRPARGRSFLEGEDRAGTQRVAILSDGLWRRRFAGDAGVLNHTIAVNDQAYTVVGILPPLSITLEPDIVLPIDVDAQTRAVGRHNLGVIGRLAPGVTRAAAEADLESISRRLAADLPGDNTGHHVALAALRDDLVGEFRRPLQLLAAAVAFVLLIGCVNVTNLLLTRGANRQREIAVRTALGATRGRIVRQLLAESAALAVLGGAIGLLLAAWIVDGVSAITAVRVPLLETAHIDRMVLMVAAGLSLASGVAAGLFPALRSSRDGGLLREGRGISDDPGRGRVRATLVAAQVALTLMLLVGAGLMITTFVRLLAVDPGFEGSRVLVVPVDLPAARYRTPAEQRGFHDRLLARLRSMPGVEAAAATSHLPLGGADNWMAFSVEGRPAPAPGQELNAAFRVVAPDYFRAMGIPLRRGRTFADGDARVALPLIRWFPQQPDPEGFEKPQAAPVAVVSDAAARMHWPGEDPVGKRIRVLFSPEVTIVGLVGDVRHNALNLPAYPHIYLPLNQEPWGSLSFVVRTSGAPERLAAAAMHEVRALDADLPLSARTLDDVRLASLGRPRLYALLVGAFGALAMALTVVGIFGVVSYVAAQRTKEIGVRIALGAVPSEIVRLVVSQGIRPIALGLTTGIAGALALTRWIETLLFGVEPSDPLTFAAVTALLGLTSLAACWLPARAAARLDPVVALRAE